MKTRSRRTSTSRRQLFTEQLEDRRVLAYADVILADNPVGYWQMDETSGSTVANDFASNAGPQNGTYVGNPTFGEPSVLAAGGGSVRFNPIDGIDSMRVNNVPMGRSFTVEAWAQSAVPVWNDFGVIASERGANGFIVHTNPGGRSWTGYVVDGGGTFHAIGTHTPASITDWHHYVITYDVNSDTARMYFDGAQVASAVAGSTSRIDTTVNVDFGKDDSENYPGLRGGDLWLDEAAIYNTALSAAQVQRHFLSRTVTATWTGAVDTNWFNAANWVDGNIADTATEVAVFGNAGAGTVSLNNQPITVDSVRFDNTAGSFNIVGGGANGLLTATALVQAAASSNTVSANLQLSSALFRADAGTLTLGGSIFIDGSSFVVEGAGTTVINGVLTDRVEGRFIRIVNNGSVARFLHIGEIEAFAPGVIPAAGLDNTNDFALTSKGASYHSQTGTLVHADDGNNSPLDGDLEGASAVWTLNTGVGNSYTANLGQTRNIGRVRVWQRVDGPPPCCQDRLRDFSVQIFRDNGGAPGDLIAQRSFPDQAPTSSFASLNIQQLFPAKLIKRGSGTLVLAGNNQYSGGTEIQGGELRVANATGSATGSGPVLVGSSAPQIRFVQVINNGTASRDMHIGELEVFAAGVTPTAGINFANNLASEPQGGSVEFTTGAGGHGAPTALANGVQETDGLTWNRIGVHVQAFMDLGKGYDVGTVRVWQRNGCCPERLQNFTVNLLTDNGVGQPGAVLNSQSFAGLVTADSFAAFTIPAFTAPNTTATLSGSGTISGEVTVRPNNIITAGTAGAAGTLRTGALILQPGAIAASDLTAGGHDQAIVSGGVSITGAISAPIAQPGYRPTDNQQFVLLANDGNDPINGTFVGAPEGTIITLEGRTYQLTYVGGTDNNDVVLIHLDRAPNAPTITTAPVTIAEGQSATFAATGTDPDGDALTFSWDINGDGVYGDATGANPTLTWAELILLGINDGAAPVATTKNISVRASDGEFAATSAPQTFTIDNAAPTVFVTGPTAGTPATPLDFTFSATDPSPVDAPFTYVIDWGDGSDEETAGPALDALIPHTYTSVGQKTISVQVRDKDGALSGSKTHSVNIVPVMVDGNGDLQVGGTSSPDRIVISASRGIVVRLNNKNYGPFDVTGEIIVRGGEGNDTISIGSNIFLSTQIFGEGGNDYITGGPRADVIDGGDANDRLLGGGGADELTGGEGNDALTGGAGDDTLLGGAGRDTLGGDAGHDVLDGEAGIDKLAGGPGDDLLRGGDDGDNLDGGAGADILVGGDGSDKLYGRGGNDLVIGGAAFDTLYGEAGDDLLIGGETTHDFDDDALRAILLEWTTGGSIEDRIDSLGGPLGLLSDSDVFSDTPDVYYGGAGGDWFNNFFGDGVKDKKSIDRLRNL